MNLPGFFASSSLYKTTAHYQMAGSFDHAQEIVPQSFTFGECFLQNDKCVRRMHCLYLPQVSSWHDQ